jgi:hypothetical protein
MDTARLAKYKGEDVDGKWNDYAAVFTDGVQIRL